ncbi:MAG: hypothetical protein GX372_02510 [Ignavibacteria bacterium]|jgi:hypothetical protein|nr:hypothetical protein [Ignavibacteria bacterium]
MKRKFSLIFSCLILIVSATSCIEDGVETLPLSPVCKSYSIEQVVPTEYLAQLAKFMSIYEGETPPNICGCYLLNTPVLVASTIPNDQVNNNLMVLQRFFNQNEFNMISWEQKEEVGGVVVETSKSVEAYVYGSGNNFTAVLNTIITNQSAVGRVIYIVSGTKTSLGIKDAQLAILMLEKDDPENILIPVGTMRIFVEDDQIAENSTWSLFKTTVSDPKLKANHSLLFNQFQGVK